MNRNPSVPAQIEFERTFTCWMSALYGCERCLRKVCVKPEVAIDYGYCDGIGVWACASSCGYRPYMEDRYVVSKFKQEELFLAVFDGHGMPGNGHIVSEYCEAHFADLLARQVANMMYPSPSSRSISESAATAAAVAAAAAVTSSPSAAEMTMTGGKSSFNDQPRMKQHSVSTELSYTTAVDSEPAVSLASLQQAFLNVVLNIDDTLRTQGQKKALDNGSTFSGVLLLPQSIVFANVGDSRGALWRDGIIQFETLDHKPSVPGEAERISKAGGFIEDDRVNGELAVSHTIGDLMYKPAGVSLELCLVSPAPDVSLIPRRVVTEDIWQKSEKEYENAQARKEDNDKANLQRKIIKSPFGLTKDLILLATDGLWDVFTSEDVMDVLSEYLGDTLLIASKENPNNVAALLADALRCILMDSIITRMSGDNITLLAFIVDSIRPADESRRSALKSTDSEIGRYDYADDGKIEGNNGREHDERIQLLDPLKEEMQEKEMEQIISKRPSSGGSNINGKQHKSPRGGKMKMDDEQNGISNDEDDNHDNNNNNSNEAEKAKGNEKYNTIVVV